MAKINWIKARQDYVIDETLSYQDIASNYGVALTVVKRRASKDSWVELRLKVNKEVTKRLPKMAGETIAEYRAKAFREGKEISDLGLKILKTRITSITTRTAKEMVIAGYKLQTEALGLNNPQIQRQVNIQNNNNLRSFSDIVVAIRKRKEEEERSTNNG